MTIPTRRLIPILTFGLIAVWGSLSHAQLPAELPLDRPGDREFVLDNAGLVTEADKAAIQKIADQLLTDKAAPIIVVTIDSMAANGGAGLRIETYARLLFDQWGIGPDKLGDQNWNHGILLLVARDDRKARIELGAGWRRDKDTASQQIMDNLIVPRFREGDYSGGIKAGVEALDLMARDLQLPSPPVSKQSIWIGVLFVGLMIFTVVSLIRRGSSGWAWLAWGVVFSVIGAILYNMSNSRSSGSGGGFSGSSFGGGFSGGGGATGSW